MSAAFTLLDKDRRVDSVHGLNITGRDADGLGAASGIVIGLILVVPFWATIACFLLG